MATSAFSRRLSDDRHPRLSELARSMGGAEAEIAERPPEVYRSV